MVVDVVEAEHAIIAIKPSYKDSEEAVKEVMTDYPKVSVSFLPEIYPAGNKVILTYETTGRIVKSGKIPISVGVTHKYVVVADEVKNSKVLKEPVGMIFKELVDLCGG